MATRARSYADALERAKSQDPEGGQERGGSPTALEANERRAPAPSSLNADSSKGHASDPDAQPRSRLAVALLYMVCAVSLTFFNKAALSVYGFTHIQALTACQLAVAVCLLLPLRLMGAVSFWRGGDSAAPPQYANARLLPWDVLRRCLGLSLSFGLYIVASMAAIRGVNVPMYTTLRRTAVVFTMFAEYMLAGQRYTKKIYAAVSIIVLGSIIAGLGDLAFDPRGYAAVFLSNGTTAIYLAVISRLSKQVPLSSFGLMWANSCICLGPLAAWCYFSGEGRAAWEFEYASDPQFRWCFAASCVIAFALNYAIFLNTQVNSAVTQSVCGNLKDVGTVAIGFFTFGGVELVPTNVAGIVVSILGSGWYAYIKLMSSTK